MKQIDMVLPTRNRLVKLKRTLNSIPRYDYLHIIVICDGDRETYDWLQENRKDIEAMYVPEHKGAVWCRNSVSSTCADGLLYATDDIVFKAAAISNALKCFNENFSDDDGVVGFVQEGNTFHPTGVALVGQKFLLRYPLKQLFCPEYFHFACQEIYDLCEKVGNKFVQAKDAVVHHYHPCFVREEMDQTHMDARKFRTRDHELIKQRKDKNLTWGFDEN